MENRIFVTSDLHGCSPESFRALLDRAGFTDDDFLFVLGDVIDRGEHGAQLLKWLTQQPNVQLILGNHEAMLLSCSFLFDAVSEESLSKLNTNALELLNTWMCNGAAPTLTGLRHLLKEEPDIMEGILDYLRDAPLWDTVVCGGCKFILVHAGLENFTPDRSLNDYSPDELLWARPTLDTRYYPDATVIFGHTPAEMFGEEYRGKAVRGNNWICIDTGSSPMLLCLNDLKEYY